MRNSFLKYKAVLLYLLFGILTTVISIAVFGFFAEIVLLDPLISNILSWIFAVAFAFFTNRKWVFLSSGKPILKEAVSFCLGRLATLGFEEAVILIFITILHFNTMLVKTVAQIAVIILNYLISKYLIFKKKKN